MGINVRLVKTASFVFVGLASGFVGVLAILINNNFYPTVGDGYLLIVLAAIFVGGTAGIGGVGTVAGAGRWGFHGWFHRVWHRSRRPHWLLDTVHLRYRDCALIGDPQAVQSSV